MTSEQTGRIPYFDYLRIFASFAVVLLHTASQNWNKVDVNSFNWQVFNFYDGITRWVVPVFVMISGALFLGRDVPIKRLYSKNILRLVTAFFFWGIIYALFEKGGLAVRVKAALNGHYHFWFLLILTGVYICMPLLRRITKNTQAMKYFMLLGLIFAVLIPTLSSLVQDFGGNFLQGGMKYINHMVSSLQIRMVLGYPFYFVLGYFLSTADFSKRARRWIYVGGLAGVLVTVALNSILALKTQEYVETYYGQFTPAVLLTSAAIFLLFRYKKFSNKHDSLIKKLSKYSFGVYLIHVLILEQLNVILGYNTLSFTPVLAVPVNALLITVIAYLISALLNKIPFVNRYFV